MTTETEEDWPLRLGFLAGRRGIAYDREAGSDWQRGWVLGNRQRLAKLNAQQRNRRLLRAATEGRCIRTWVRKRQKKSWMDDGGISA